MSWGRCANVVLAAVMIFLSGVAVRAQAIIQPDHLYSGATTPAVINTDIQGGAEAQKAKGAKAARYGLYTIAKPKNAAEFDALAQSFVVMVTVITQTQAELPLKRAYLVTSDGVQTPLRKLSSWRSAINAKTLAYSQLGKFREDGFYLIPGAAASRPGTIQLDFAVNRVGFQLVQLPVTYEKLGYEPRDPSPGARADNSALRSMIQREFPGFPVPKL